MITPVILCGGNGTRLWPLSRDLYPKQLLALTGDNTLLQQTALRLADMEEVGPPLILCNENHRFLVAEQLHRIGIEAAAIILEPVGRNTAPATALAALHANGYADDTTLLILPADHLVRDIEAFRKFVVQGQTVARKGRLVTFGIVPVSPETGYGYIKKGAKIHDSAKAAFVIAQFVEKPDIATAVKYFADGSYSWNSGMFMFQASVFIDELKTHNRTMYDQCWHALAGAKKDLDFIRIDNDAFYACPSDSIDYAVMEKTRKGVVIPIDVGWNDIGSWSALWEVGHQDDNSNVTHGDVLLEDTKNSFIYGDSRLVATIGIDDLIIVETVDAVLVALKDRVQDVKKIVTRLKTNGREEANLHRRVFRPWGSYEGVISGERFQVKLITVKPGAILSLQMHHHRAEHWVVVRGTARITKGEDVFFLSENQSTYIPLGVTHRLENPGVIPLELIEVQSGSYLGEDDITRFEDNYGRAEQ
jgi:mannose-1-phosphate guanylyltransferase/mannose-6-phosphate isomerase